VPRGAENVLTAAEDVCAFESTKMTVHVVNYAAGKYCRPAAATRFRPKCNLAG
jgi:hypothetical protein